MGRHRVLKIDLSAMDFRTDPFTAFGRLREQGPMIQRRITLLGNVWLATTYQAVGDVLKDSQRFVRDPRNAGKKHVLPIMRVMPRSLRALSANMLGMDEPDHRRLRTLVDQAFGRQSIAEMREQIAVLADKLLDHCAAVAATTGRVDLVEHFARPLPMAVICQLLGLPDEDRAKFKQWFAAISTVSSVMGLFRLIPGARKAMKYLRGQFQRVRRQPRDGLISALVEAEHEGGRLNESELLSMVFLLLVAGHETTVHLISTGVLTLLQLPGVRAELLADRSKTESAVEEMLRYNSPVQFAKGRFVASNLEFHGQPLRRGETVVPLIAAANYDPARFVQPDRFDLHRSPNYHLSFGTGPHVCLGLKLARAETEVAIHRLLCRWPELRPAFDLSRPDWARRIGLRSLRTLEIYPN